MAEAAAWSAALRCAFSLISSCFFGSLARMGTKSEGTGVLSLKFLEKPLKSFNLTFLSCITRCLLSSATRLFCFSENCLNAFNASTSTLVALGWADFPVAVCFDSVFEFAFGLATLPVLSSFGFVVETLNEGFSLL